MLADCRERGDAAERRADQGRRESELADDREHVAGERVERVVAVGGPLAVAVAAQVDGVGAPPLVGQRAERRAPRVAGLAAAVQQDHGWVGEITRGVGGEAIPVASREFDHARARARVVVCRVVVCRVVVCRVVVCRVVVCRVVVCRVVVCIAGSIWPVAACLVEAVVPQVSRQSG